MTTRKRQRDHAVVAAMVGNRLRFLRFNAGLSQMQVAGPVGIGRTTLSSFETSMAMPSLMNTYRLCKFYGVSMDYLFSADQHEGLVTDSALERFLSQPRVHRLKRR